MRNQPAICEKCGAVFNSGIAIGPGVKGVTITNCSSVCPKCGGAAKIMDRNLDGRIDFDTNKESEPDRKKIIEQNKDALGLDFVRNISFIRQLIGGLYQDIKYSELERLINQLLSNYSVFYSVGSGLNCYRGRKTSKDNLLKEILPKRKYTKISDFACRPAEKTYEYGRCHQPHNPVFYASGDVESLYSELNVEEDEFLIVAVWYSKKTYQMRSCFIGSLDHYRKTKTLLYKVGSPDQYNLMINAIKEEVTKRLRDNKKGVPSMYTDAFLAHVFAKPAHTFQEYKITSIVSKYLLENRKFDILGYPSVKHFGAINYAMKPDTIEKNFELRKIVLLQIENSMGFGFYGAKEIVQIPVKSMKKPIEWPIDDILNNLK